MDQNSMLDAPSKQQILNTFSKHNFSPKSLISKPKLEQILNSEHKRLFGTELQAELIEQIWEQSQSNSRGQILVNIVVDIILQAQGILRDRITKLSQPDGMISRAQQQIAQKQQQLSDYKQYYSDQPFKINQLTKQLISLELSLKQHKHQLEYFSSEHYSLCKIFSPEVQAYSTYRKQATVYHSRTQKKQEKSKQLLFVFHLTWILIIIQLLITNIRVSLLVIGVYIWSFHLIMLSNGSHTFQSSQQQQQHANNEQQNEGAIIGYWMILAVVSIIADIIFVVIKYAGLIFLMPELHTDNNVYYQVLLIITIVTIGVRIIMIGLYSKIRSKCGKTQQYFRIFGSKFYLFQSQNSKGQVYQTQYISS